MARLDAFFQKMFEVGASDLHLTTGLSPYFRLHGEMMGVSGAPSWTAEEMKQVLFEIAPKENQEEFERDRDTDFAYELPGKARFRANLFMDRSGPGAVFRQIPCDILTADQLGLPKAIRDFCFLSKGLVLVTGPTGSGKSTTLAAMIDLINKSRTDHIITIEDPIEFVHKSQKCLIHQREIGRHTKSFKRALRAALREDPDIVLVGEMRDLETIEIAIETAETGHLVFGTLHTTTAISTVDRIVDQFPADRQSQIRTMLGAGLKGVVAQTLCKKKPAGRCAALEILVANDAISALIREGKTHQLQSQMQMGGKLGMKLLNDSLAELVQKGQVEPLEAYIKAVDKQGLLSKFQHMGVSLDLSTTGEASAVTQGAGATGGAGAAPSPTATDEPAAPLPKAHPTPQGDSFPGDFEAFRKSRRS